MPQRHTDQGGSRTLILDSSKTYAIDMRTASISAPEIELREIAKVTEKAAAVVLGAVTGGAGAAGAAILAPSNIQTIDPLLTSVQSFVNRLSQAESKQAFTKVDAFSLIDLRRATDLNIPFAITYRADAGAPVPLFTGTLRFTLRASLFPNQGGEGAEPRRPDWIGNDLHRNPSSLLEQQVLFPGRSEAEAIIAAFRREIVSIEKDFAQVDTPAKMATACDRLDQTATRIGLNRYDRAAVKFAFLRFVQPDRFNELREYTLENGCLSPEEEDALIAMNVALKRRGDFPVADDGKGPCSSVAECLGSLYSNMANGRQVAGHLAPSVQMRDISVVLLPNHMTLAPLDRQPLADAIAALGRVKHVGCAINGNRFFIIWETGKQAVVQPTWDSQYYITKLLVDAVTEEHIKLLRESSHRPDGPCARGGMRAALLDTRFAALTPPSALR